MQFSPHPNGVVPQRIVPPPPSSSSSLLLGVPRDFPNIGEVDGVSGVFTGVDGAASASNLTDRGRSMPGMPASSGAHATLASHYYTGGIGNRPGGRMVVFDDGGGEDGGGGGGGRRGGGEVESKGSRIADRPRCSWGYYNDLNSTYIRLFYFYIYTFFQNG